MDFHLVSDLCHFIIVAAVAKPIAPPGQIQIFKDGVDLSAFFICNTREPLSFGTPKEKSKSNHTAKCFNCGLWIDVD